MFVRQIALGALAAGACPSVVRASALGGQGTVPPSERITVGFIGTGRQAIHANIPGFLYQADAQVVAVCDVDSWRMAQARALVDRFSDARRPAGPLRGCATFADWRELLARRDIDAVMISTPDHWHVPMALAALKAGKDVSCEKPLARTISEGRALADAVKREGKVFCTDSEFRTERMFHKAAQLARNNKLGKLQRIITTTPKDTTLAPQEPMPVPPELNYKMWLGSAPKKPYTLQRVHPRQDIKGRPGWLCIRDYADGMLANWGAHLNDIAMWANDTEHTGPVEIEASGKFPPPDNLWNVIQEFEAHFLFANGVRLLCKTGKPCIRLEGTEGWVQVDYPSHIEVEPESLLTWEPGTDDLKLPRITSEKRNFLDAVKSRSQPLYDAEAGHRNSSLSHLAIASIELGRKLKWDPEAEVVVDDQEANRHLSLSTRGA